MIVWCSHEYSQCPHSPGNAGGGAWLAHKRCKRMWLTMRMRCVVSVCLDSFALLAWLQDEPGADITEGFLRQAASGQGFQCFVSAIMSVRSIIACIAHGGPKKLIRFGKKLGKGLSP